MLKLKLFLLALLYCCAPEGDDDAALEGDDHEGDDELPPEEEDQEGDDELPPEEEDELSQTGGKKPSRSQQRIIELSRRAKEAEAREHRAQAELEAARQQTQQTTPQKTHDQKIWEQEEAILNDPAAQDWQKYSINSARDARAARAEVAAARRETADAVDRTRFERFAESKPKLYDKYKTQVEELKAGNLALVPREEILALLIGRDVRDGKVKPTETKKPAPKRETPPGVRSDVRGKPGKMSEAEARAKRLENVRI